MSNMSVDTAGNYGGWTCCKCGAFVLSGEVHYCSGTKAYTDIELTLVLIRISQSLEKIAASLERRAER
jgi:hypothetical protein